MQDKITYLRIMLTRKCNLACSYCHHEGVDKPEKELDARLAWTVIRACYMAGMRKFKFIGGEPTLYGAIPAILEKMSWPDADISMISNGLFSQDFLSGCLEAGLSRINISIHAWNSAQSFQMSGMTSRQLALFRKNIEFLLERRKLGKFNYVYLRNGDKTELFSIIDWINECRQTLDILNVIYDRPDSELAKEYCDFAEIRQLVAERYEIDQAREHYNAHSLPSERLYLKKGGVINLKKRLLNACLPFNCCRSCHCRDLCREGILAIRLTPDGFLQPCLLRADNCLDLSGLADASPPLLAAAIANYIQAL